jgi:hypothetical protein
MFEIEVIKHQKKHSLFRTIFVTAQSIFAILLVIAAVTAILIWLMLLAISFTSNSGLMPWVSSGVSVFGLFFIFLAAVPGIPGIIWVSRLIDHVTPPLDRILKITVWVGKVAFKIGAIVAILILALVIVSAMR